MCVIAVKPSGVALPTTDKLQRMWNTNRDGAGFMYAIDNNVHIEKGFMTFEEFNNAIEALKARLVAENNLTANEVPVVMHFRIATHGGTNRENTHPFPLTSDDAVLKSLDTITHCGIAHNGIITSVKANPELSDTAMYIKNVLYPLSKLSRNFVDKYKELISASIGYSKLAFMKQNGSVLLVGDFKESTDKDGLYYSNLNHEPAKTYYPTQYGKYNYNKDVEDYWGVDDEKLPEPPKGFVSGEKYYVRKDYYDTYIDETPHIFRSPFSETKGYFSTPNASYSYLREYSAFDLTLSSPCEKTCDEKTLFNEKVDATDTNTVSNAMMADRKDQIGGKKNIETIKLTQSANREFYIRTSIKDFILFSVEKGTYLTTTTLAKDMIYKELTSDKYVVKVASSNWFYSPLYNSYVYRQKDGTFIVIDKDQIDSEYTTYNTSYSGTTYGKYTNVLNVLKPIASFKYNPVTAKNVGKFANAVVFVKK